jgi:SRSO17 transposase
MPILEQLQNHFQSYVWKHVQSILVGRMLLREVKTLTALQCHQSLPTLSRTLNVYEWPLEELRAVRRARITQALKKLRTKRGRPHCLYLIIDDTVVPKRGKKLPALGFHFSSSEDRVVQGWDWVFAAVRVGSLVVPWDWRGYVNEHFVEAEDFQKRTELACELIRAFEPPVPGRVIVLTDSAYCCAEVIRAAHRRGFTVVGLLKKNRLLAEGRRAWEVPEETVAFLQGLEIAVKVVHRGRGKGRRTVISTDLSLGRQQIQRHLKRRWGIEVMFKLLKEQFGLGDCRCRGPQSLARWVELVLLAYVLAGLTRWGKQLRGEPPRWGEVRQEWGWSWISLASEVRGWLATLWRLLLWGFQLLPPISVPMLEQEAILTR